MNYSMRNSTDRPFELWACYGLVGSAILYGVCRFWDLTVPTGLLLTPPFVALSFLLSRVALRVEDAVRNGAWITFGVVIVQGLFCLFFEAAMVHMGLEWLNEKEAFAPGWVLWPASFALSLFNVGSVYAFAREIPQRSAKVVSLESPTTLAAREMAQKRWKRA